MRRTFSPDVALALVVTLARAIDRKLAPALPPSQATLARLYDEAKREDWNRDVVARKAAKKRDKQTRKE